MITVLFHMTVRPGHEERFHALAQQMTRATHEKDRGCIRYTFHRQQDDPRQYVLYEQWQDQQAIDDHLLHMQRLLGSPKPGTKFPAVLFDITEKAWPVFYTELGHEGAA